MTEKLNTNAYPILDICTIEIPEGETLPETMPILSFEMMARLSTRRMESSDVVVDANSPQGDAASSQPSSESDVFTIDAFPKLHNVHIRHRIPHPASASATTTTTVTPELMTESTTAASVLSSSTTAPDFTPLDLGDDDTLEVLEEIDYMSNTRPSGPIESIETNDVTRATPATTHRDALRPFHHVRHHRDRLGVVPVPEFKPIRKRVVMSRRNLMETLQEMISKQEQTLERERSLISDELAEE